MPRSRRPLNTLYVHHTLISIYVHKILYCTTCCPRFQLMVIFHLAETYKIAYYYENVISISLCHKDTTICGHFQQKKIIMELRVALSRSLSEKHAAKNFISHSICIRPLFLGEYLIVLLLNYLIESFRALRLVFYYIFVFLTMCQFTRGKIIKRATVYYFLYYLSCEFWRVHSMIFMRSSFSDYSVNFG